MERGRIELEKVGRIARQDNLDPAAAVVVGFIWFEGLLSPIYKDIAIYR